MRRINIAAAAFLCAVLLPAAALARNAVTTSPIALWAGPGYDFPVVDHIPSSAAVNVYGCTHAYNWCDVAWHGHRGFTPARYLASRYNGRRVIIANAGTTVGIPILAFNLGTYWNSHYRNYPFYARRTYWKNYYNNHYRHGHEHYHEHGRYVSPHHHHRYYGHNNGHHEYHGAYHNNGHHEYHGASHHNGHNEHHGAVEHGTRTYTHGHHHTTASNAVSRRVVTTTRTVTTNATPTQTEQVRRPHHHGAAEQH